MRSGASRALWVLGWPARVAVLGLIQLYRFTLGPLIGSRCRFYPSCSAYAREAVRTHGVAKGVVLAAWRVLRCSPLSQGGPDLVPERGSWKSPLYDSVIRGEDG